MHTFMDCVLAISKKHPVSPWMFPFIKSVCLAFGFVRNDAEIQKFAAFMQIKNWFKNATDGAWIKAPQISKTRTNVDLREQI